ncbi:MAG: hypothetical protein D6802_08925 [Ardenticatenia bacterium]|nr:MAG: hypothetical protein D6802_08925 [Ardenticatenia bacterium]
MVAHVRPEAEAKPLRLHLFGAFHLEQIEQSDTASFHLPGHTLHRLFAALALHAPHQITRVRLAGMLFPNLSENRARRALNQAIWQARKIAGRAVIESTHTHVRLGDIVWSDVVAFREHAAQQQPEAWQKAIELYKGDFWPDGYDDWVLVAREQLREQYLLLLERLSRHYESQHDYEAAIHYMRLMAQTEPLREHIHHRLMQLYLALDRPLDAIRQYETIAALLQQELNVAPSSALQTLQAIAQERLAHTNAHEPSMTTLFSSERRIPFIGRHAERQHLLQAVEYARQGHGGIAFVEGAGGLGKSRLAHEIAEGARWRGLMVGTAKSEPNGSPYNPLREAIDLLLTPALIAHLQKCVPPHLLTAATQIWSQFDMLGEPSKQNDIRKAMVEIIREMARQTPMLLILEDIHAADPAIFDILTRLAPDIERLPLLVILTYRPLEAQASSLRWERLLALDRTTRSIRVRLSPFTTSEKALFISTLLQTTPEAPIVQTLTKAIKSNIPLHIIETLRYLHRRGLLRQQKKSEWHLTQANLPLFQSFSPLIAESVRRLPEHHRRALEIAAIVGQHISTEMLALILPNTPLAIFHDLVRYGFLDVKENQFSFTHALVHESIYNQIDARIRRRWHQTIAEHLLQHPNVAWEQIAHHFEAAGLLDKAQHAYREAATQALDLHAYEQALVFCQSGLALSMDDAITNELWLLRGRAELMQGQLTSARSSLAHALWMARNRRDFDMWARGCYEAGTLMWRAGSLKRALHFYRATLHTWQRLEHTEGVIESEIALAEVLKHMGRLDEAERHLETALGFLDPERYPALYRKAVLYKGVLAFSRGHFEMARTLLQEAHDLSQSTDDLHIQGFTLNSLARIALHDRRHDEALDLFQAAFRIARQLHNPFNEIITQGNIATTLSNKGLYEQAIQAAKSAFEQAKSLSVKRILLTLSMTLAWNYTMLGAFRNAKRWLHQAETLIEESGLAEKRIFFWLCRMIWYREQGSFEEAFAAGQRIFHEEETQGNHAGHAIHAYEFGCTLLLMSRYEQALAVFEQGLPAAASHIERAFIEIAQAAAYALQGQTPQPQWEEALRTLEHIEQDEYLPRAWYHAWLILREQQHPRAQEALHRAYAALQMQGLDISHHYRQSFLNKVLSHRLITQAWLACAPHPIERLRIALPKMEGDGEILVSLTLDAGEEDALVEARDGHVALRRHRIQRLLREAEAQGARLPQRILADILHVSLPTLRRDLRALRKKERA